MSTSSLHIVMSGGGTGGHIFPALALAEALQGEVSNATFLFIGAKGKMEMKKVPAAGYRIEGLPITGFQRKLSFSNLLFPFRLVYSQAKALSILRRFKPHLAVGTGGFASGPALQAAQWLGVPTFIQEQNAFPGVTNRMLGKKANAVFTAFDAAASYFPQERVQLMGNPVRKNIESGLPSKADGLAHFSLKANTPCIFITGGSLGARTLNQATREALDLWRKEGYQILWQCGSFYEEEYKSHTAEDVFVSAFIDDMAMAYAAADVIVARAGAITLSELTHVGKPTVFIPSPNVAGDHQTKNAAALVEKDAALSLADSQAVAHLGKTIHTLLQDEERCRVLAANMKASAKKDAARRIARFMLNQIDHA